MGVLPTGNLPTGALPTGGVGGGGCLRGISAAAATLTRANDAAIATRKILTMANLLGARLVRKSGEGI
jgi:hypothetical protein